MDIDLNSDLGEGSGLDAALMPLLTSANISCGFHAGDLHTAWAALSLAIKHGVQIGAHPGYPDRASFGRQEQAMAEQDVYKMCLYQVGALDALARALGGDVEYLKPHGALYNQACRDDAFARPIVAAAAAMNLELLALPGSRLEALARGRVCFHPEGFADRRYRADGSLVPRSEPDAFISDPAAAAEQAVRLIESGAMRSLCVHGDNPDAVTFVQALRQELQERGHTLRSFA